MYNQFKVQESDTMLTLKNGTKCMLSPIGLPLFSSQQSFLLYQDQKGLSKACNGAECKDMVI